MIRNAIMWFVIFASMMWLFQIFSDNPSKNALKTASYSEFIHQVDTNNVAEVMMASPNVTGFPFHVRSRDGKDYQVVSVGDPKLIERLTDKGVDFKASQYEQEVSVMRHLMEFLYILPFLFLAYMVYRNMQGGGGKAMGFGKSRARLLNENQTKITFEDVAGIDEAKEELEEIVEFLKDPQKFQRLGGRIPKGVLLVGPPGTGKTLLAKAIAGEAGVPFFSISGSDFVEMFVGVGASRVRDMFEQAKKSVPCIIFIDEIDAVGGRRGSGMGGGGNDEREQTLNQLLVEMDGFEENQSIILVAATNRPDILDPALLRPGRFDRQVNVPNPDVTGREQILKVHMRKVPLSPTVDPKVIARGTPGFSGADLANLVNEAALLAARRGKLAVGKAEFDVAKDKIMMGAERRTLIMTEAEMRTTAYHEGGHAIVSHYLEDSDPIHKATIVPRGRALGMVQLLPEGDRVSESRNKIIASIKVSMGGRIAEELIFGPGKVTTGAQSDIKAATYYATHMITETALGDTLGFRNYSTRDEAYPGLSSRPYSEDVARKIDDEINALLDKCYAETAQLLKEKEDELHRLGAALLERETLTGDEIRIVLEGGELPPMQETTSDDLPRTSVPTV
jgi:cell division protease FtsH